MDVLPEYFKAWKESQKDMTTKRKALLKRKRYLKQKKHRNKTIKLEENVEQPTKVQALSDEFLNELTENEPSVKKKKKSEVLKKNKKKLKVTSSLIDNADFIPLESNVTSTDFKIVRLDRDSQTNPLTKNAIDFYNRRLNGKNIHREPTKKLFVGGQKLIAKHSLCVKR